MITLQDVAVIMGLPIERQAVIGHGERNWPTLVHDLLGVWPENTQDPTQPNIIIGLSLKLTWLRVHFSALEDDVTVDRHARAYILYLFGCILFQNESGDSVQLIYLPLLEDLERVDEDMVMGAYSYRETQNSDDSTRWATYDAEDFEPVLGSQHCQAKSPGSCHASIRFGASYSGCL
ncbi:protein MAIN-LIKE 2-like [Amaranthus tricolor]|uniref:protein MAIN-LIKE 2-like n=1 Tax=Amaranthus tricolor TaxID=29722 RepID=UPI00258730CF|nr:protein MAIN-LIKE 2-like [Amaranthus tricolor]